MKNMGTKKTKCFPEGPKWKRKIRRRAVVATQRGPSERTLKSFRGTKRGSRGIFNKGGNERAHVRSSSCKDS